MNWHQLMESGLEQLKTSGAAAAEPWLRQALEVAGDITEFRAVTFFNLGLVTYDLNRPQEAESFFAQAIEIVHGLLPEQNELYGMYLKTITEFYEREGRFADSKNYYLLEIEHTCNMYGASHPYVANVICEYSDSLIKLGEYALAEKNLGRAFHIMSTARGEDHVQNGPIHSNLAKCYEALGRKEDAEYHQDRADEMAARQEKMQKNRSEQETVLDSRKEAEP